MQKIRVLIADDQKLFAGSIKVILEHFEGSNVSVVAIAYDGREAVELVKVHRPDLVLLDIRMPVMDGVQASKEIHEFDPDIKILILTTFDDDDYVYEAFANGAIGYVLKEVQPEELVNTIRSIVSGSATLSPLLVKQILKGKSRTGTRDAADDFENVSRILSVFPDLGKREAEVLYLIADNYDNREIAAKLFIAEQTVKNYISGIYTKIGVSDRLHAIRLYRERIGNAPKPGAAST